MITRFISPDCLLIYIKNDELISPLEAVRTAMKNIGMIPWAHIEAEEFVLGDKIMIIARPRAPKIIRKNNGNPRLYRF